MLSSQAIVKVSDRQVSCAVGDERILLHLEQGVYYGLEGVGAFLWEFLSQPRTLEEMIEVVVREYQVEREQCSADLQALVADLRAQGLVMVVGEP